MITIGGKRLLYIKNVFRLEYNILHFLGFNIEGIKLALDYEGCFVRRTIRIDVAVLGLHLTLFIPVGRTKEFGMPQKDSGCRHR